MDESRPEVPAAEPVADAREAWLSRLGALWIWSIFFGVNGGLTYTFLSPSSDWSPATMAPLMTANLGRSYARYGPPIPGVSNPGSPFLFDILGWANLGAHLLGLLASVAAWVFLYVFFSTWVVPAVLVASPQPLEPRRRVRAALCLRRTYQLLILATLARVLPGLAAIIVLAIDHLGVL